MGLLTGSQLRFRLYLAISLLFTSLFIGTAGYMLIEHLNLLDSLYMTVITISTVGYGEVAPLSTNGRIFSIILILGNIGIFTYTISIVTQLLIDGELQDQYKRYKLNKRIMKLKEHTIVCGFGRNGQQACKVLEENNIPFVVVEKSEVDQTIFDFEINHVQGDARQDHILQQAGIERANALITALPDDASNVFVVITARHMNPFLTIISRATNDSAEEKLRRAGASNVIMPDKVGGAHMASLVTKPDVMEFIDLITGQRGNDFQIAELSFEGVNKKFRNQSIGEMDIRGITGANIIGFKSPNGDYVINPQADQKMSPKCKLIVLGTKQQIDRLKSHYLS